MGLRKVLEPRDHKRQQVQLHVEERFHHVKMAVGPENLVRCNAAFVLIRVELQHCSDILWNDGTGNALVPQFSKSVI